MQLFKILSEIRRRKALVAAVLVASVLIGLLLAYKPGVPPQSRQYQVALASSDILVDTSNSQVVDVGGHGPDLTTLASRANLLGNLMTVGPLQESIARSAGIDPEDLVVVPPANAATPGVAPTPVRTSQSASVPKADETVLTLSGDETLPILHVVAQAPDPATASKLAVGTIVELRRYLGSVAATQKIPAAHQIVVRQIGAPLVTTATRGLPRSIALVVTIVLALLGLGAIVGGSWFVRSWKRFEETEGGTTAAAASTTTRAAPERGAATASAGIRFPGSGPIEPEPPVRMRPNLRRSP